MRVRASKANNPAKRQLFSCGTDDDTACMTADGLADRLWGFDDRPGLAPPVTRAQPQAKRQGNETQRPRQPDLIEQLGDRDTLFALLSRVMPWSHASAATASLLNRYGTFTEVLMAPGEELEGIAELDIGAVGVLKAAHAAALRIVSAPLKQGPLLSRWSDLEAYLTAVMARDAVEHFRVLFLDARNRLIADEVLATGTSRGVHPDHRVLVRRAVHLHATAVILAHNHPSGDPRPSSEDIETTRCLRDMLDAVSVVIHDHLVVGRGGIVSLRKLGVLGS